MKSKIKLKPIDLSKTITGNCLDIPTTHPNIKPDGKTKYLCKIGKNFLAGTFCMRWYGLCFERLLSAGIQFDPPKINGSEWKNVWEIIEK